MYSEQIFPLCGCHQWSVGENKTKNQNEEVEVNASKTWEAISYSFVSSTDNNKHGLVIQHYKVKYT